MTPVRRRLTCAALALALAVLTPRLAAQSPGADSTRLVVVIVVDQLRADYLERYSGHFTGGLKRLMESGAYFDRAAYPYLNTITCAGHSTIGTGSFPYRHGMILNTWFDPSKWKSTECTDDTGKKEVSYGPFTGIGDSAHFMRVPTLAETIRRTPGARTVTMSLKARSAIGLAGHKADLVLWFNDKGNWSTSTTFAKRPAPFLQEYIAANPLTADFGKTWELSRPASDYQHADDVAVEKPPTGWTKTFPHRLGKVDGTPDAAYFTQWRGSPYSDEYMERMAEAIVGEMKLGAGPGVDFLGVSFSALDGAGHAFGPQSFEVQDLLLRLDRTIGALLDRLDAAVGKDAYVLALSADHGVGPIPETVGGGRHTGAQLSAAVDAALQPRFGKGKYVAYTAFTDIYLGPGVYKRVKKDPDAAAAVKRSLEALPGIARVYLSDELSSPYLRTDADPITRAAALSHAPGRSGDLILVPREHWILSTSATTHGTANSYDQRVPVIFYGRGIAAGRHSVPATPADIAPTLAAVARVRFTTPDGRVLTEAMAQPGASR